MMMSKGQRVPSPEAEYQIARAEQAINDMKIMGERAKADLGRHRNQLEKYKANLRPEFRPDYNAAAEARMAYRDAAARGDFEMASERASDFMKAVTGDPNTKFTITFK